MDRTNQDRTDECAKAIAAYSDGDPYTNLVDWLADAMHWCQRNGHDFAEVIRTASTHFDEECREEMPEGSQP